MPSWKKVLISGSDAALNSLNISSALTASGLIYPTTDGTSGQVLTTDGSGQLSFSSISGGGLGSTTKLNQTVAATTWSFAHNLGEKFPVVNVYDSNDEIIIPQRIDAIDNNNMLIYFSSARTGTAAAVVGGTAISASYALTASYVEGIVNSFPYTGSAQITGSLAVTGSVVSTGGFTGSLQGNANTSTTASYALTASYLEGLVDPFPYTGSAKITGSLEVTGSIRATLGFTGSLLGNASTATSASYALNATTASYALTASNAQNAQDILIYVKNISGTQIDKGKVVRISGSTGDNALIVTASYTDDANSANTLGITYQNIPNDSFGYVITEGTLIGINTDAFVAGQLLYLGPAGSIIGTAPIAPLHGVRLGEVLRVQQNNGSMYVRIDNGYELGELHDVRDTSNINSHGDLLIKSGSVWTNSRQLTGSYGLTGSLSATSFTGSLQGNAATATSASLATTASYVLNAVSSSYALIADNLTTGSKTISGDLTVTGRVTAEEFHTEFVSSSIIYRSGSTKFGDTSDDVHAFTGSLEVQGSLTGSLFGTASWATNAVNATSASYALSASSAPYSGLTGAVPTWNQNTTGTAATASYVQNAVSASHALTSSIARNATSSSYAVNSTTASYALTASFLEGYISPFPFTGSAAITGSLQVTGSVTATSFIKSGSTGAYLKDDGSTSTALNSRVETNFIATANQTTFPLTYEIGQLDVYYNGSKLYPDEFAATNGTSIVLAQPATLGAQISTVKYVAALTTTSIRNESTFNTTAGQTTFNVNYTPGQVDVFYNGSKLNVSEFTATNGTSVVLGFACAANESIAIVSYVNQVSGASGTTGYIPRFTGAASFGNSLIKQETAGYISLTTDVNQPSLDILNSNANGSGVRSITVADSIYGEADSGIGVSGVSNSGIGLQSYSYSGKGLDVIAGSGVIATFSSGGGERLRILNNGNVGIGVSAPTTRLDIGNGTLTAPTLRGRTYTLSNVASQNPNLVNGTGFNSIPVRVGDVIDFPFSQTRTVIGVTDTQLTLNANWSVSFAGSNVEGRGGIVFETNNAERMRMTAGGNLLLRTTTDSGYQCTMNTTAGNLFYFTLGSGNVQMFMGSNSDFYISTNNGQGVRLPVGATSWSAYSDIRLKNVTGKIINALSDVDTLSAIKFRLKSDESNIDRVGLIAQEVQKVLPEAVDEDQTGMLSVRYTELIPLLVASIQELKAEIEILKNK